MQPNFADDIPKTDWSQVMSCCDGGRCAPVQKPASCSPVAVIAPELLPPGVEVVTSHPEPSGGHPEFQRILTELWNLHRKKGADYGTDTDPLANIRASKAHGVEPFRYAMLRADEKMTRYKSFVANGSLRNESLEETLLDLASQAILALVLLRE